MDIAKSIRIAVDSGKVLLGTAKAINLSKTGGCKLLVISSNCPTATVQDLKQYSSSSSIPVMKFDGTSVELGAVCGKPFPVSVLSVVEEGNSDIMNAAVTA